MTQEQAEQIARRVVARVRPAMRVAIGDSTPRQYDRADVFAQQLYDAVVTTLVPVDDEEVPE